MSWENGVRVYCVAAMLTSAVAAAGAKTARTQLAVKRLREARPEIEWDGKSAAFGDVNCDGKLESIVLGRQENKVVVAVVSGDPHSKPQLLLTFPIRSDAQDGFCSMPVRIQVVPLDCSSEDGPLAGCKSVKGCKEFSVADDECDSFNFYWNFSQSSLGWWRH